MYWQDNPAFLGESLEAPCGYAWGVEAGGVLGLAGQKAELMQLKARLKQDNLRSSETLPLRAPAGQLQAEIQYSKVIITPPPSRGKSTSLKEGGGREVGKLRKGGEALSNL